MTEQRRPIFAAIRRFSGDKAGNMAVLFAGAAMAIIATIGASADYANLLTVKSRYQGVADAAALAAAKEFRLVNADPAMIANLATTVAKGMLTQTGAAAAPTVTPTVDAKARKVTVEISAVVPTYVMQVIGAKANRVAVTATAAVVGGTPICVIGLESGANSTLLLDKSARLQAPNCAIYSNSTSSNGLMAKNSATVTAGFICSAGGKSSPGPGSFTPEPQTDCPIIPDPLAARPAPPYSGCNANGKIISTIWTTLTPGVYCGGLTITLGAHVTFQPGVYVFKDGPLVVNAGASLDGANVGLFFTGAGAVLNFDAYSHIALTAPAFGDMAGLLVFEDRASPAGQVHQILSNDARMLLGTIYLPQNRLHVAAMTPVADQSAYTIVVARLFTLSEGPTMVLNTNYGATNIPTPPGVGPAGSQTALTK